MTHRYPSTHTTILAPITSIDAQLEEAEAAGWSIVECDWKDAENAWALLLKRNQ